MRSPNLEVTFRMLADNRRQGWRDPFGYTAEAGYYWQLITPGLLPEDKPKGPFATKEKAIVDARKSLVGEIPKYDPVLP